MLFKSLVLFCCLWIIGESKQGGVKHGHGNLHPSDETHGTKNFHKLELVFDSDCVDSLKQAEEYYDSLILSFGDCLSNETTNTSTEQNVFRTPKNKIYFAYIEILYPGCEDDIEIDYDDYCIENFEYEPFCEQRSSQCTNDDTVNPDNTYLWHLDYIDGETSDNKYNHLHTDDAKSDIYIIDWGTRTTHQEFSPNRATQIGVSDQIDYHGTHCAGIAGGNTVGTSKSSPIYTVAIDNGAGQSISAACEAVIENMESRNSELGYTRRSVVSMSWGWSFSSSDFAIYNDYFDKMAELGGVMFAATTNSLTQHPAPCSSHGKDGPGGCDNVITVSNYQSNGQLNGGAGYGECVDVAGPGTSVVSAWYTSDTAYNPLTGTSMATPAVAGFVANMLNYDDSLTVEQVRSIITDSDATTTITATGSFTLPALNVNCDTISELIDASTDNGGSDDDSSDDDIFTCDSGCTIAIHWKNDGKWCDCSNCEDEDSCSLPYGANVNACVGTFAGCGSGYGSAYYCDNGCEISSQWWNDGVWCDCPNCEDEQSCSCGSSGCPSTCGGYTSGSCSARQSDTDIGSRTEERDSTGGSGSGKSGSGSSSSGNNDDAAIEILIYVCIGVGGVIILLIFAVCMIRRNNLKKQIVEYQENEKLKPKYAPPSIQQDA